LVGGHGARGLARHPIFVTPAKAGVQLPSVPAVSAGKESWIPAFAGMT
jgi:hypothetical protein